MISFSDFTNEWNNKFCKSPNGLGGRCVDLANEYLLEVLGLPEVQANAVDWWTTYPPESFNQIANAPSNAPEQGDLIIWSKALDIYGHIAICNTANPTTFQSFDQNWPIGSNCHFQEHNYTDIIGWLRPKTTPTSGGDTMTPDEQNTLNFLRAAPEASQYGNMEGLARAAVGALEQVAGLQATINTTQAENTDLKQQIVSLNAEMVTIKQEDVDAGTKELAAEKALTDEQNQHKLDVANLNGTILKLQDQLNQPAPAEPGMPVKQGFFAWLKSIFGG